MEALNKKLDARNITNPTWYQLDGVAAQFCTCLSQRSQYIDHIHITCSKHLTPGWLRFVRFFRDNQPPLASIAPENEGFTISATQILHNSVPIATLSPFAIVEEAPRNSLALLSWNVHDCLRLLDATSDSSDLAD